MKKKSRGGKRAPSRESFAFSSFDGGRDALKAEREKARELRASQWWLRRLDRGVCDYCGRKTPRDQLTMDHLVPLARGGKTTKNNLVCACKECNNKKKSMLPTEWALYLDGLKRSEGQEE